MQVLEDVAVVEPAAGVVLGEFDPEGVGRAEGLVVDDRAVGFGPAMAVQVEGVEEVVDAVDVEGDPLADLRFQGRRVAGVGVAVEAVEDALAGPVTDGSQVWKARKNSRSGRASPGLRITSGPNSPLKTGSGSIGPWSW